MCAQHINLNIPYYRSARNKQIALEKSNSHIWQGDNIYNIHNDPYLPHMIAGGSLLNGNKKVPKEIIQHIEHLIEKYHLPNADELQGSGLFNMQALKMTLKQCVLDNEFIMSAIKIGAVSAVTTLVASLGAPVAVVAMVPILISWTEIGIKSYIKNKNEIESKAKAGQGYFSDLAQNDNVKKGLNRLDRYSEMVNEDVQHIKKQYGNKRQSKASGNGIVSMLDYTKPQTESYAIGPLKPKNRKVPPIPKKKPLDNPDIGVYKGGNTLSLRQRRTNKVKEIMAQRNCSMIEASKYIKNNKIAY